MRRVEVIPHRRKRRAEIAQQLRQHLADGLRLPRQLRQVVPIIDRPLPEALARMGDARAVAPDKRDRRRADARDQIEPGPPTRHRVPAPSSRTSARGETVPIVVASATKGVGRERK